MPGVKTRHEGKIINSTKMRHRKRVNEANETDRRGNGRLQAILTGELGETEEKLSPSLEGDVNLIK